VAETGLLEDGSAAREQAEQRRKIEPLRVVDESVARVGHPNDRETDAVATREPLPAGLKSPKQPLPNRAKAHHR
jgi:hypothetical protein